MNQSFPTPGQRRAVAACGAGLLLYVMLANAWACDDSYITARAIEQLFAGHGPRWNPHDRTQVFTSAVWFFILALARLVSADHFANTLVVSVALMACAAWSGWRVLTSPWMWLAWIFAITASKGTADFFVAGLENPLLNALLVAFAADTLTRDRPASPAATREPDRPGRWEPLASGLWASAFLLVRHDAILFAAPALAWRTATADRGGSWARRGLWLAIGLLPFAAWTAFCIVWYGVPLPNTAYAKLGHDLPGALVVAQGLAYIESCFRFDRVGLPLIGIGIVSGLTSGSRRRQTLAAGLVLYLAYVVSIGGDFMQGRFLGASVVLGSLLAAERLAGVRRFQPAVALAVLPGLLAGLLIAGSPWKTTRAYDNRSLDNRMVADEKGFYFADTSIWRWWDVSAADFPPHRLTRDGKEAARSPETVLVNGNLGFYGFHARLDQTIIDPYALADPLLARLPAGSRRPGHYQRTLPEGYVESIRTGSNMIADPAVHARYDQVRLLTQADDLWSGTRWRAIVRETLLWTP